MVWVIRILGDTVAIRHPRFPAARIDITKTEAAELSNELALALHNPIATPFKPSWRLRLHDWLLLKWLRLTQKPQFSREEAQRMISGGWSPPTDKKFREGFYE